jgi:DNA-binding response OmpR family regulator
MAKILLIDNDVALTAVLQRTLQREGYDTLSAEAGPQGLDLARTSQPDLVLLEARLPDLDGFSVCRMLRFESDIPILMLTVCQDEAARILGLDLGADDYMLKPFLEGELLARIRALLRRSTRPVQRAAPTIITISDLSLDITNRRVFRGDKELSLAQKEFDLLACLMYNRGVALAREVLLEQVWGDDFKSDIRTVDVHIRWLRAKIEPDPTNPRYIYTVRGLGYRFTEAGAARRTLDSVASH